MITNIDENFGRLRATLDELGIADNTILIFMTDNGTATGVELDADQFPPRRAGQLQRRYARQKRVCLRRRPSRALPHPLPQRAHRRRPRHRRADQLRGFHANPARLVRVEVPAGRTFHGQSLAPLLRGADDATWPTASTSATPSAWPIRSNGARAR